MYFYPKLYSFIIIFCIIFFPNFEKKKTIRLCLVLVYSPHRFIIRFYCSNKTNNIILTVAICNRNKIDVEKCYHNSN